MKQLLHMVLFVSVALGGSFAYGQGSLGPAVKKPRTPEDYKAATLKEILAMDADLAKPGETQVGVVDRAALLPFRVRVVYTASVRPISAVSEDALDRWARCCAGSLDHYKSYTSEMRVVEHGASYWLVAKDKFAADLKERLEVGDTVELFLIRIRNRPDRGRGRRRSVLLVESFKNTEPGSDKGRVSRSNKRSLITR
jgi:hypothetical protein